MKKSILCFGGPVLDRYYLIEDGKMEAYGLNKGQMALYNDETPPEHLQRLLNDFKFTELEFGGSAINTVKAYSMLGGEVGIVCSYGDDERSKIIETEAAKAGVKVFPCVYKDSPTSYLLILVTPDAQRTVCGSFYPSFHLDSSRVDFSLMNKYDYSFLETYSFAWDDKQDAIFKSLENIEKYNKKFIFALSNPFYVTTFKDKIEKFMNHENCKIVIGNAEEFLNLYSQFTKLEDVMCHLRDINRKSPKWEIIIATDGKEGAWLLHNDSLMFVTSPEVEKVIDTTGAGDYFATGALFALMNGYGLDVAAKLANMLAGDIISRVGVRLSPEVIKKAKDYLLSCR